MRKSQKPEPNSIPPERCHLFGIRSIHTLGKKLGVPIEDLERWGEDAKYRVFNLKESGRRVEEPPPYLQALHRRIHRYLSRIFVPNYLHSAVKGRSYISNARAHIGLGSMIKIDIKKFFPSVPQHRVMQFFRDRLNCAGDVSGLLAKLLCKDGRLPTGGAASPIISYYAFKPMFDEIEALCSARGLTMTCYVDDIAISGKGASRAVLQDVRQIITRAGLAAHKAKFFDTSRPKTVTGVVVGDAGIALPHSRWKAIKADIKAIRQAKDNDERLDLYSSVVSRLHEAAQIDPRCRRVALYYNAEWKKIKVGAQVT